MIGTIIGAGLGVAGSIFGGLKASEAARQAKQELKKRERENQAWFDRRYNEDATQRADAQRMLTRVEDSIRKRNKALRGQQAVVGATDEAVATQMEQNNQMYSDAVGNISAHQEARKDAIEGQYHSTKDNLSQQAQQIEQQRAQAISQATSGVLQTAGGIASAVGSPALDSTHPASPTNTGTIAGVPIAKGDGSLFKKYTDLK